MRSTARHRHERAVEWLKGRGWEVSGDPDHSAACARPTVQLPTQVEECFDADGSLVADLPFTWAVGSPSNVQTVFAREGLVVRVPLDSDAGPGWVLAGRAGDSDLCRIVRAFQRLEALGYIAEPDFAFTNSSGWTEVHERSVGEVKAIFWNSQAHLDCFDDEGALVDDIPLQWAGDADEIETALRTTDLIVDVPEVPDITFFLGPQEEEEEDFCTDRSRVAASGAGPSGADDIGSAHRRFAIGTGSGTSTWADFRPTAPQARRAAKASRIRSSPPSSRRCSRSGCDAIPTTCRSWSRAVSRSRSSHDS